MTLRGPRSEMWLSTVQLFCRSRKIYYSDIILCNFKYCLVYSFADLFDTNYRKKSRVAEGSGIMG